MNKRIGIFIFFLALILAVFGCIYSFIKTNSLILQGEVDVKTVDLSSKIAGRVKRINYQKGDRVKKGDEIIEKLESKVKNHEEFSIMDSIEHMLLPFIGCENQKNFMKKYTQYMKNVEKCSIYY